MGPSSKIDQALAWLVDSIGAMLWVVVKGLWEFFREQWDRLFQPVRYALESIDFIPALPPTHQIAQAIETVHRTGFPIRLIITSLAGYFAFKLSLLGLRLSFLMIKLIRG